MREGKHHHHICPHHLRRRCTLTLHILSQGPGRQYHYKTCPAEARSHQITMNMHSRLVALLATLGLSTYLSPAPNPSDQYGHCYRHVMEGRDRHRWRIEADGMDQLTRCSGLVVWNT